MKPAGWVREPIVHFAIAGAVLFGAHRLLAARRPDARTIVVSADFVEGLRQDHRARTGRAPTADEERALVDRFVDEEIAWREAVALGLDRGDLVVRRRMAQKMDFVLGEAAAAEPTDAEAAAYLVSHRDRYADPARVSFRHVFFARDRRGGRHETDALRALGDLRNGASPEGLGDAWPGGADAVLRSRREIEADFGADFAREVRDLEPERWQGPIASAAGVHLVRVGERRPERIPALSEIRDRVARDLVEERRAEAQRAGRRRMRERYRVVVASGGR